MKKRAISLILTFVVISSCVFSAIAASGFDRSIMSNGADIDTKENEMNGIARYTIKSMIDNAECTYYDGDLIFYPVVFSSDTADYYSFAFSYESTNDFDIDEIVFRIGNRRYRFYDLYLADEAKYSNGKWIVTTTLQMDFYSISMLDYIAQHRDKEIKVLVDGSNEDLTITLNTKMKDWIIYLYNLYVQAGGLRSENLKNLPEGLGGYGAKLKVYDD